MEESIIKNQGKLFIGGLSPSTTTNDLKSYFSEFGKVIDCGVVKEPNTKQSQGFGYVTFLNPNDAKTVFEISAHILKGRLIQVQPWRGGTWSKTEKNPTAQSCRVFLRNLPPALQKNDLKAFFSRYGKVTSIFFPTDSKTNKRKGCAFLEFESEKEAKKCIEDRFVYLCGKKVHINKATPSSGCSSLDFDENMKDKSDCEEIRKCVRDLERLSTDERNQKKDEPAIDDITYSKIRASMEFLKSVKPFYDICQTERKRQDASINENMSILKSCTQVLKEVKSECLSDSSDSSVSTDSDDDDDDDDDFYNCSNSNSQCFNSCCIDKKHPPEVYCIHNLPVLQLPVEKNMNNSLLSKVRNKPFSCSLCQWSLPNSTFKTFLDHCKTPAHKLKLKNRFRVKKSESDSDKLKKAEIKKPKEQLGLQEKKNPESKKKPTKSKTCGKNILSENVMKNSNFILKSLAFFIPFSDKVFKCNLCDTKLPPANNLQNLISNAINHLNSKNHKKNLENESIKEKETKNSKQTETAKNQ